LEEFVGEVGQILFHHVEDLEGGQRRQNILKKKPFLNKLNSLRTLSCCLD
jgi:hypothetical protein